jgi:hypothetical protein
MCTPRFVILAFGLTVLTGCGSQDEGFALPEGDAEKGKADFVALGCIECHEVHNVDLPAAEHAAPRLVKLGGVAGRPKTYEALVTGIINPSHRLATSYAKGLEDQDAPSPMKVYNEIMTVAQLIDIVTFLEEHYEPPPHDPSLYPEYVYMP